MRLAQLLIVGNSTELVGSLKVSFESLGFHVETCLDHSTAIKKFTPQSYNLLLIDLRYARDEWLQVGEACEDY